MDCSVHSAISFTKIVGTYRKNTLFEADLKGRKPNGKQKMHLRGAFLFTTLVEIKALFLHQLKDTALISLV